jgi:hypothetical protein
MLAGGTVPLYAKAFVPGIVPTRNNRPTRKETEHAHILCNFVHELFLASAYMEQSKYEHLRYRLILAKPFPAVGNGRQSS